MVIFFLLGIGLVELALLVVLYKQKQRTDVRLHDLKNTLTNFQGVAFLLKQNPKKTPEYEDLLVEISQRACQQIKEIFAGCKHGNTVLALNAVVDEMQKTWQVSLPEKVTMEVEMAGDDLLVWGDKISLERLLDNLVQNACRAMPQGGKIKITCKETDLSTKKLKNCVIKGLVGKCVMLTVQDEGEGIAPTLFKKIFRPFFSTFRHGVGLGLTSVGQILKRCQASLALKSAPKQGSRFCIYFPSVENFSSHTKMLIVDDDGLQRALLKEILGSHGQIWVAATPYEAIALMQKNPDIDLLIADMLMPNMNGDVLYHRLAEFNPVLKAVFLSGKPCDNVPENALFLEKPYQISELKKAISQLLAKQYDS